MRYSAGLLIALCGFSLGACDDGQSAQRMILRQNAVDPPRLWRAEALDASGLPQRTVDVCIDGSTHDGLARANAEVNGEPCHVDGAILSRPGFYSLRCEALGRRFAVTMTTRGDLRSDFTTQFRLQALDGSRTAAVQTRRYRLIGDCPPGWRIGDQAPPGARPRGNALE